MIRIREACSNEELESVYELRYRIYVEEMRRPQKDADHSRRRIEDSLDATGINLAAWHDSTVVGVARVNLARDSALGMYDEFYDMRAAGTDHPWRTSITTRLMVAPEHRHSVLPLLLVLECYRVGLAHNLRWNFIDCNDHLVGFFERIGFVPHLPRASHPEYGPVNRMRLDLLDEAHLESVSSPFLGVLKERTGPRFATANISALDY